MKNHRCPETGSFPRKKISTVAVEALRRWMMMAIDLNRGSWLWDTLVLIDSDGFFRAFDLWSYASISSSSICGGMSFIYKKKY
jgi:hypothetical protein